MNETISNFIRDKIVQGLQKLPEAHQRMFKLMYGRNGGRRSVEDTEALSVEFIIAEIPEQKLDWALSQIERSLDKLNKE